MSDFEIIAEIETILGISLKEAPDYRAFLHSGKCYLQENGNVIGLDISSDIISNFVLIRVAIFLQKLERLIYLRLQNNQISDVTPLSDLNQLERLYLYNNQINNIAPLSGLNQLTELYLGGNQISDIAPLSGLNQLTLLRLRDNQISDIAPLSSLNQLTKLSLDHNQISNITPLNGLNQLTELWLSSSNQISDITPLSGLNQLTDLRLNSNRISDVTPLSGLNRLTTLDLDNNRISDVTPLSGLEQLTTLFLSSNQISDITSLRVLKQLSKFSFSGNHITDPPPEISKQGWQAVLRHFERHEKEVFAVIREAKLILVGDGAAGKTSLKLRLKNSKAELPPEFERTRGIDVSDWKFEKNFTAHVWDFGGQDVYYPVHRFFITENAVFVLLASTRNDQHNFAYWIPTVYQFGGTSPTLIGQTRHDGASMPWNDLNVYIGDERLNIVKNGAGIYYPLNLKDNNAGLTEIKREIIHQLEILPHCQKSIPKSWVKVRETLKKLQMFCIHYSQFKNICKDIDSASFATDDDYEDCCRFFHATGSLFWYDKNTVLRDWVVLAPKLVVDAVYKIIDDPRIKSQSGHIYAADFKRLWADEQYKDHHTVLKEILKEFRVAFAQSRGGETFVFPALMESLPEEKTWRETPCITAEFEYNFMPKAIVNQVSAELSDYIPIDDGQKEVWNNAVNLAYEGTAKCQVKEEFYDRKITVKAGGRDARGLIMMVMGALKKITRDYKGVKYDILIPCTCEKCANSGERITMYNYNDLSMLYNEEGRREAYCQWSNKFFSIDELIYNVGLSFDKEVPETEKMKNVGLSFDKEVPGTENKKTIRIFLASSKELAVDRNEFEIFIGRENKRLIKQGIFIRLEIWEDFIDAMSPTRLQDEYNRVVREADIFVSLFHTKAGKFTEEEFDTAFGQFKAGGKPYIYTYFKNTPVPPGEWPKDDFNSLHNFKDRLKERGHFPGEYIDTNDLLRKFKSQLEKLMQEGKI